MNTCRIKGKKGEEKENKIQRVPLWKDKGRLSILWNQRSHPEWQRPIVGAFLTYNLLILNMILLELQTITGMGVKHVKKYHPKEIFLFLCSKAIHVPINSDFISNVSFVWHVNDRLLYWKIFQQNCFLLNAEIIWK